ncbi:hypothetical protein BUE93_09500 [Chromobacterium amazonense]|uniref:Uncharacterized protein n=1 Tax=Chromobacterium amazonense TaxID=1382803 RepID=A0A2S9X5D0_9NEIS|nr:hypothetical protein [Chromobacterium amazonense]PRP70885.1 hypothetical protein BUE93_09500 [Chromobacterium amazonense]
MSDKKPPTKPQQVEDSLAELLCRITLHNGYRTNIGQFVQIEGAQLRDDEPVLVICGLEEDISGRAGAGQYRCSAAMTLQAQVCGIGPDYRRQAHNILADIKRCLRANSMPPGLLRGAVQLSKTKIEPMPDEGAGVTLATVELTVEYDDPAE